LVASRHADFGARLIDLVHPIAYPSGVLAAFPKPAVRP
jgi:hypothetical protein